MSNRESRNVAGTTGTLEADYHMLLEQSIDAIVVVGQDGLIRFVNPAAETILGDKAEELLGESFRFSVKAGEATEVAITGSGGETVVAEMRVMETDWQGESAYFVSLRDITERKRVEEAVRESEGRYKALTDNLNVAVYRNTPGPKGKFVEVNPAHFRMFGYESKEEFLAVDVSDMYQNPEDRRELSEKLSRLGSAEEELRLKRKDGTPFIGLVSAVAVKDENHKVLYFDGIIEDITERKRAEALLKESEKRHRNLVEMAPVGIVTLDTKGIVTSCNPAALDLSGRSEDEVLGRRFTETGTIRTEDASKYVEIFSAVLSGAERRPVEYTFDCKDGTTGWAEAHFALLEDRGKAAGIQVILRDITERKRTEEITRIQRDLGLALGTTDDLHETMRLCVEATMGVGGMDCGGIYLVDRESGEMNLEFHKGLSPEFVESVSRYDADLMNTHRVMAGKPIYSGYEEIGVPIAEVHRREGIKVVSIIPVNHEGQIIACLIASSHTLDYVSSTTRNALETIANQMGSSIARVQTEAALRDSEERYRILVENANEIILVAQDGNVQYVNPKIVELMGYSEDEMKSRPFTDFIHPDDRKTVLERHQRRLRGEDVPNIYSFRSISKDGNIKWMQANSNLIKWGRRSATLSFLTDVTERKEAEDALQESEKRYRLLIETADAAIAVIGDNGDFLLLNNQAAAQMNGKPDDLMGKNMSDILSEEALRKSMEEIREVINSRQGHIRENQIRLPSGEKWLSTDIQPIVEQDGSISSVQIISQDITRYKKQEEALLRNLEREDQAFQHGRLEIVDTILHNIGNAMTSVTIGAGTAQKKVVRLTRYLCSLADAIKKNQDNFSHYVEKDPQGQKVAPLIIALADEFGENDGNLVETVDRVAERAERVAEIIRTVESVAGKMYRKDIDLKKAVEDAITVLKYSIEKRHIEVKYDCNKAPAEISAHESQFHQMLVNLIKNSMEAIDELEETDGTNETHFIAVRCFTESDSLALEVTDDGIGIEESLLEVIFRPGYSTKSGGTGSGLHSIANFVKRCDGHIQALSDGPGKGATIRVTLPLAKD